MVGVLNNSLKTKENFVYPECEWGYRFIGILLAVCFVVCGAFLAITIRDDVISIKFNETLKDVYKFSAEHGLYIEDVIVEGNYRTSYEDLIQALNLSENESILGVDIENLKSKIEELTWVKKCVVKRSFFPHNILVNIEERNVKAIWQFEGRYYPVDEDGKIIDVEEYEPDEQLLVLTGENAYNHLKELLEVLKLDEELNSRIKAAIFVSNRRWNLVFDNVENGVLVKLPEKDYDKAYQKIALLNKRQGIFKRKLTSFDVRFDNRVVVDIDKSFLDLNIKR